MADDESTLLPLNIDATQPGTAQSTDAEPDECTYPLAPELPRHYLQSLLERLGYSIDGDAPHVDPNERRFSLFGLLACLGVLSVVLAIGRNLPLAIFAGLAGLAVVVGQIVISVLRVRWSLVHLAWWLALAVYLVASACAVLVRWQNRHW